MRIKKKHIIIFILAIISIYVYFQFKEQKEKDHLFYENCESTDKIHFREGFISIYFLKDPLKEYIEQFDLLHIRDGLIIDTIKYTEKHNEYEILQFDLRTYDTIQVYVPDSKIVNIYGFKNKMEYRFPNKITDCNLQVYMIDNIEYKLEEYYKINLSDRYFIK